MKIKGKKYSFFQGGPKQLVIAVLVMVGCIIALAKLTDYTRQVKTLSYSTFLNKVEHDEVKWVHVSGQDVQGALKNGAKFETVIPYNPKNWDLLKEHNVEIIVENLSGQINIWYLFPIILLLLTLLAVWYFLRQNRGSGGSGSNIFTIGKSRAKLFMPLTIQEKFDSVAGATEAKEELKDVIDFLKNPEKYRRLGANIPRGVLLVGEPGNGKTILAKAVAGEANCPFFSISGSDFIEVFVGVGAARVRDLFMQARKCAPSIIFIDEIDAIGRQRGTGFGGGHDEREQTLNQLLTEMDGFQAKESSVIVIAATNMPDVLDKALLRPGRFDRRVNVPFPDAESREEILKIHARGVKIGDDVDFKKIADNTAGFSGADLAGLMNKAAINASKSNQNEVTMKDLEEAHRTIILSRNSDEGVASNPLIKGNSNAKMFMPSQVKVTFDAVAGVEEAKEELQDVIDFLKRPEKYRRLGAKIPRGALLVGEPGNGKTMLAKAVAGEANCPFFSISASEFIEMYVGVGASRVRDLFAQARKHSPSIIFIDEIDAIGGHRNSSMHSGDDERNQTLNQLLTEMDGFQSKDDSIIVIAATNRPDVLDKALLRPGRFDRRVEVPYPDLTSREKILLVHAKNVKIDPNVDLKKIARGTPGFSGADLAHLINEAAINASKHDQDQVMIQDFEEARDKIMLGKEMKSKVQSKDELHITAYHESGHVLVRLLMPEDTDPLHKVTIIPRGRALGVTHWLPEKEKYTTDKNEMLASVMSALGGRAAEELVFNKLTTGAYSDFKVATNIVRDMVCHYGMSDIGPVVYGQSYTDFKYSQKTAELIDQEVTKIIDRCYKKAIDLLQTNRDKLNKLAETLLAKETMYASEIYELLGIKPRQEYKLT